MLAIDLNCSIYWSKIRDLLCLLPLQQNRVHHSMEDAGHKLKRVREKLNLRFREVEDASQQIAIKRNNDEFLVAISRLSDIENRGTVPSIFRIYSLCSIYRLNFVKVLKWYGVDLSQSAADSLLTPKQATHLSDVFADPAAIVDVPASFDPGLNLAQTTYLSRMIEKWGTFPLEMFQSLDLKTKRYAFIGSEDWFMYPLLRPTSLVVIDDTKRKPSAGGWSSEFDRPIYFLEHREGYACSWCSIAEKQLILVPHPASLCKTKIYNYPEDITVIGQVTGVAMWLDEFTGGRVRS